ncbi:MAG TPA: DNA helicase [Kiloniellaceae bacterium]|nr:DNA helicase [Kiloniellaceae bacterium]
MKLSAPVHQLKRRAKQLARDEKIAWHEALDRVARAEGFAAWSLLSARQSAKTPAKEILSALSHGDLLLLGARPGHGKTLLGLQLLLDAVDDGRRAVFFTLEYSAREAEDRIRALAGGASGRGGAIEIVTSDAIDADYIVRYLADAPRGTLAVIDYLQILDQPRHKPVLSDQVLTLRDFARKTGVVLAFISQIDRSFEPDRKALPDIRDVRLPNRLDLGLFSKACFLHDGAVDFNGRAAAIPRE